MKIKKIYVAGKFELKDEIKKLMNILEDNGFEITCDWTKHKPFQDSMYSSDPKRAKLLAEEDLNGVKEADCLVVLYDDIKGPGTSFEMGYATALGKRIFMLGIGDKLTYDYSVFVHLDNFVHYNGSFTSLYEFMKFFK